MLQLLAGVTHTGWDSIQNLDVVRASGPLAGQMLTSTALRFENSWRVGIGADVHILSAQARWSI